MPHARPHRQRGFTLIELMIVVATIGMVMPEMSGAVLAQQLATIRPDMGLIYMSGYADYTAEALEGNHVRFLQKPFAPDAALRAIRDVLDSAQKPAANTQALKKTQPLRAWSGQSPTAQFT